MPFIFNRLPFPYNGLKKCPILLLSLLAQLYPFYPTSQNHNQNQNNLYSTHVVAVNKILLYSVVYMYVVYRNSIYENNTLYDIIYYRPYMGKGDS